MNKAHIVFTWAFILVLTSGINAQPQVLVKENYASTIGVPDIIFHNGNVITMDEQKANAQAIAIEGNVITAVGADSDILAMQTGGTQLIDLEGRTVVPGLIEGHSHGLKVAYQNDGRDGLKRAAQNMAADGYTTVHELGYRAHDPEGFLEAAAELGERGELAVRMNVYLTFNGACGEEIPNSWNGYPYTARVDTMLRIVGVKAFGDGGSCNHACLSTPWQAGSAAGTFGDCYFSQAEWDSIFVMILDAGYPIAMHALGDSAVAIGLNAFEQAFAGRGNTLRCRMEHLRAMRADLIDKMATLGIGGSIQYTWARAQRAPASTLR